MNLLIATIPKDIHAGCVKLAMKYLNHDCTLWYTSNFPYQECHTFSIDTTQESLHITGKEFYLENSNPYDVVWLRRPRKPARSEILHFEDRDIAHIENNLYFQSMWHWISPKAFWINHIESSRRANHKALQLQVARKVGFAIPDTIISNNHQEIKKMLKKHGDNNIIYKSLAPIKWNEEDELRVAYTQSLGLNDLPEDHILQNMIGIFQQKIEKKCELRITCMGRHLIAVKIDSQNHEAGKLDWRKIPPQELSLSLFSLPADVQLKCLQYMQAMGIVFGCFDLILTPNNEYYFLEVNEQGQFLWIEEVNSSINMLDPFIDFLTGEPRIRHTQPLRLSMFIDEAKEMKSYAMKEHAIL